VAVCCAVWMLDGDAWVLLLLLRRLLPLRLA
jgi:hypothetical protein